MFFELSYIAEGATEKVFKFKVKVSQHFVRQTHLTCQFFHISMYLIMEQRTLKNVNNCFNTNIYSFLETSGSKSYNLYLNVVHFINTSHN
jgi:hypothetical protein